MNGNLQPPFPLSRICYHMGLAMLSGLGEEPMFGDEDVVWIWFVDTELEIRTH